MEALKLFQEYMGTGLIMIWFLVSLLYLWVTEKRKYIRILFVYVPLVLLLVFFNPVVAKIISGLADGEIYYRILWLLPVTPVVAFTAVSLCGKLRGYLKYVGITAALILFMLSGSLIYRNPYFQKAENVYHVPQSVVDICDAIEVPGREVMAVFPGELLQYNQSDQESGAGVSRRRTRRINLNTAFAEDEPQTEEDRIAADIMSANGNTVDFTA